MQILATSEQFAPELVLKVLRSLKHLCMGEAAHMDELQRAKAIPHLVALLRLRRLGPAYAEIRSQCVNALYLLCQINRSRQEAAAIGGALPLLQEIIEQGSPLKQFALPILCDIAKASKRARAELKQHNGVQFYLGLLSTSYWQESALDALLVWLLDEPSHVARFISSGQGVAQLGVVMEAKVPALKKPRALFFFKRRIGYIRPLTVRPPAPEQYLVRQHARTAQENHIRLGFCQPCTW